MNVVLLVVTDGRRDLLERTAVSFRENCDWPFTATVVADDSGDFAYTAWAGRVFDADTTVCGPRAGGAGNINRAWDHINHLHEMDYVFHLEDDWTFCRPVDVEAMAEPLRRDPWLAQMVLRRQPWGGEGPNGYIDASYTDRDGYMEHDNGFWLNPCLYPAHLCYGGWPSGGHEHDMTRRLSRQGFHFGVWGRRDDPPAVWHIGTRRSEGWCW